VWLAEFAGPLALAGHEADARTTLQRYLSLPGTQSKTIAALKKQVNSDNAASLAMHERFYEGLCKAGMPAERGVRPLLAQAYVNVTAERREGLVLDIEAGPITRVNRASLRSSAD